MDREEDKGKPLVIMNEAGEVVGIAAMNRKAFTKSTEHGELWIVHDETGRVLPYGKTVRFSELVDEGNWYRTVIKSRTKRGASLPAAGGGKQASKEEGETAPAEPAPAADGGLEAGAILRRLSAVIERRKVERPEGSYTTYLFDSGEEKIRKKTGEEAIELVLARDRGEIVSEAADLIYHLLVLLNQLAIPVEEVFEELEHRA